MTSKEIWNAALEYQRTGNDAAGTMVEVASAFAAGAKWHRKHQPRPRKKKDEPRSITDEDIMRVLHAIGYEEESWLPFVKEHLK